MRYLYSVIRFVPDSARGESVNLGVLAVSDESGDCGLRHVDDIRRATALDREAAQGAAAWLADLAADVNDEQLTLDDLAGTRSEAWLRQLHREQRNLIQFSEPRPMVAPNLERALDQLYGTFVGDPERRSRQTKQEIVTELRDAYVRHAGLRPRDTLYERVLVRAGGQATNFDFAVANGSLAQLSQAWTLAVQSPSSVLDQIRSWGYTVHRVRREGARLTIRGRAEPMSVPADIPIRVLYLPPSGEGSASALEAAVDVWRDLGVNAYRRGEEDSIAAEVAGIGERHG